MKAAVLGLGESLKEYSGGYDFTIGVNDIFRYHKTDYLVVVDRQERFTPERLHQISMSSPEIVFSQHEAWRNTLSKKFSKLIFGNRSNLDSLGDTFPYEIPEQFIIPHSISSPFVAACIAYKLGATEIKLYGCDYKTHPQLSDKNKLERTIKDFTALKSELNKKSVQITCTSGSALTEILK